MEQSGEVLRFEPSHTLEWAWGDERVSFNLEPDGEGTRLTFVHVFEHRDQGANCGSGWHSCFNRLQAHLERQPVPDADPADLVALNDRCAKCFGLDREVGRGDRRALRHPRTSQLTATARWVEGARGDPQGVAEADPVTRPLTARRSGAASRAPQGRRPQSRRAIQEVLSPAEQWDDPADDDCAMDHPRVTDKTAAARSAPGAHRRGSNTGTLHPRGGVS